MNINFGFANSSLLLPIDELSGNEASSRDFSYIDHDTLNSSPKATTLYRNINIETVKSVLNDLIELSEDQTRLEELTSSQAAFALESEITHFFDMETAILNSSIPIEVNESEEIELNGEKGMWINKHEETNWKGSVPIKDYPINVDLNPELIYRKPKLEIDLIQELVIRYLRPPTPPAPGDIIINQMSNFLTPPAPPLIIRQQPFRSDTPEPLVIREAPPPAPPIVGKKIITISGKRLPPPPRKVIVERLPHIPSKPQAVLIERWLPFSEVKRRVIFNKPTQTDPIVVKPKNVIIQWESPQINMKKEFKYLGIIRADPNEYVRRYGSELIAPEDLPQFVFEIKPPEGIVLAADKQTGPYSQLYGDLDALKLIDLEYEGLSEYKDFLDQQMLENLNSDNFLTDSLIPTKPEITNSYNLNAATNFIESAAEELIMSNISSIFRTIDFNNTGFISIKEAENTLMKLNKSLGTSYDEDEVRAFFDSYNTNSGFLDLEQFKKVFLAFASSF